MEHKGFLDNHGFGTQEAVPLRLRFWYYEYLKRHLLQHSPGLCWDIAVANMNLRTELSGQLDGFGKIDTTKLAVREYILRKHGYRKELCIDADVGPVVVKVINSTEELQFLSELTEEYGHYAHLLTIRHDMSEILKHINAGKDVADIGTGGFACHIPQPGNGIKLRSDMSAAHQGVWKLDFSINIFSDDFDFAAVLDEVAYQIAVRRHFLAAQKKVVGISREEGSIVVRKNLPPELELNKHSSDKSRAIGLWCWDAIVFLSPEPLAMYKRLPNRSPLLVPFPNKKDMGFTNSELLFDLVENGLLLNFPGKKETTPCHLPEKSFLYGHDGTFRGSGLNKNCKRYESCIRRLGGLISHANLCIEERQVIPVGKQL